MSGGVFAANTTSMADVVPRSGKDVFSYIGNDGTLADVWLGFLCDPLVAFRSLGAGGLKYIWELSVEVLVRILMNLELQAMRIGFICLLYRSQQKDGCAWRWRHMWQVEGEAAERIRTAGT